MLNWVTEISVCDDHVLIALMLTAEMQKGPLRETKVPLVNLPAVTTEIHPAEVRCRKSTRVCRQPERYVGGAM